MKRILALVSFTGGLLLGPTVAVPSPIPANWSLTVSMGEEDLLTHGAGVTASYQMENLQEAIWISYSIDYCDTLGEGEGYDLGCSSQTTVSNCGGEANNVENYYQEAQAEGASPCCVNSPPQATVQCSGGPL